jgi:hypothetical protein
VESILHPEEVDDWVESVVGRVREQAQTAQGTAHLLGSEEPDQAAARALMDHPLPHWVERMTTSYLEAHGGSCERRDGAWRLIWPNGDEERDIVFSAKEALSVPAAIHLTLGDARVRRLATDLAPCAAGQPFFRMAVDALPAGVCGFWSLWRITVQTQDRLEYRIVPVFLHDNGRFYVPTARFIWDQLLSMPMVTQGTVTGEAAREEFARVRSSVEEQGEVAYGELLQRHRERLEQEKEKGEYAFAARRRAIQQLGLTNVRLRRLADLDIEAWAWRQGMAKQAETVPNLECLILLRVEDSARAALA